MKVLVVTHGEYSDYHICAIYSDDREADAQEFARMIGGQVEPWGVDAMNPQEDPGMDFFYVQLGKSGEASQISKEGAHLRCDGTRHEESVCLRTDADYSGPPHGWWNLIGRVYAKDEEAARRRVWELWRQIQAGQRPECVDFGKN